MGAAIGALALGGCTTETAAPTSETWQEVTAQQAVAPPINRIDVYAEQDRTPPRMDRNGCATSVVKDGDVILIGRVHPREVYCVAIAPLRLTTVELPAGARVTGSQSGMMDFLTIANADAGGRTTLSIQAKCTPVRKDDKGELIPGALHQFFTQQDLPFCPRPSTDMVVTTSSGVIPFRLIFNADARTRVVDVRNDPRVSGEQPTIPIKPADAQDLHAEPVDNVEVPWVPDDAWATGTQTVIVWHRPMPTLPSLHIGVEGEMQATPPTVINDGRAIAMIYPRRLTEFQLRMDKRAVQFGLEQPAQEQRRPNTTVRM